MLELKAKYRDLSIFRGKYTAIFQRCKIFFDSLQKKIAKTCFILFFYLIFFAGSGAKIFI